MRLCIGTGWCDGREQAHTPARRHSYKKHYVRPKTGAPFKPFSEIDILIAKLESEYFFRQAKADVSVYGLLWT